MKKETKVIWIAVGGFLLCVWLLIFAISTVTSTKQHGLSEYQRREIFLEVLYLEDKYPDNARYEAAKQNVLRRNSINSLEWGRIRNEGIQKNWDYR